MALQQISIEITEENVFQASFIIDQTVLDDFSPEVLILYRTKVLYSLPPDSILAFFIG